MDDRGQSVAIGIALATIVGLGIYWLLFTEAWDPLKAEADTQVTNATAQTTLDWLGFAWDWYLLIALAIVITGTIAAAVFQRELV